MTSVRNRRIILSSRPESLPTEANYSMTEAEIPVPGEGEVLARILMLSIDPAMRGWVLETPNYAPPVPVGDVIQQVPGGRHRDRDDRLAGVVRLDRRQHPASGRPVSCANLDITGRPRSHGH